MEGSGHGTLSGSVLACGWGGKSAVRQHLSNPAKPVIRFSTNISSQTFLKILMTMKSVHGNYTFLHEKDDPRPDCFTLFTDFRAQGPYSMKRSVLNTESADMLIFRLKKRMSSSHEVGC